MNKYLLVALHCCMTCISTAQPFAVQTEKMNVLYVGMPNEMHIVVNDIAPERLVLLPSMGKIDTIDLKSGYYNWKICKKDTTVARLVLADSISTNPIDTLFFRVKRMPDPTFRFVPPKEHSSGGIAAVYDSPELHFMKDKHAIVVGFNMCRYSQKSDFVVIHSTGGRFSSYMRELYYRAKPGDRYSFYNFQWKVGCDETIRKSTEVLQFLIK